MPISGSAYVTPIIYIEKKNRRHYEPEYITNPKYNMVYDVAFFYFYIAMCYLNPEKQYNRRNTSPQKLTHQIYLFKVNNRNTRKRFEICYALTIQLPQNDVNDVVLVSLLLKVVSATYLLFCFVCLKEHLINTKK